MRSLIKSSKETKMENIKKEYKIFRLPKGNGKFRTIYSPKGEYKAALIDLVSSLSIKAERLDKYNINYAFMKGRNVVMNAEAHIGYNYTLSMDLSNFFDSVRKSMVKDVLNKTELELCFIDNIARQGLPTSPAIANIAFLKCDKAIIKTFKKQGMAVSYTRYADDLTFSFNNKEYAQKIIDIVKKIVTKAGFKINTSKTKLQDARNGRRIITGIGVDKDGVHPTRKILRKIRAAEHQKNSRSLQGLKEFAKCKVPKHTDVKQKEKKEQLLELSKRWGMGLRKSDLKYIPKKETIVLGNDCVISGDPIDMLRMSTFTTGWTTCMSKNGSYKKGVPFWILLKGTRLAYRKSDKIISFGKIERNRMISRCLLHELRNGVLVYDKFYGHDTEILKKELEKYGAISMEKAKELYKNERVVGNVPIRYKPYFDNLNSGTGKRKHTTLKIRYAYIP